MTYEEIRNLSNLKKGSHKNEKMKVEKFDNFSVMLSDKTDAILVDNDIVDDASKRKWCIDSGGYPIASINGKSIRLFDYVMAHHFKERPKGCYIDHVNQDKLDNRKTNLRFVTPTESSRNMPLKSNNKTGITGVCKGRKNKYRAYITIDKKHISLGEYGTLEEAASARLEAETRANFKTRPKDIASICEGGKSR